MSVDVDRMKRLFAKERYNGLLREWYMIKTSSEKNTSTYSEEKKNIDRFLLLNLLESNTKCCIEDIKLL